MKKSIRLIACLLLASLTSPPVASAQTPPKGVSVKAAPRQRPLAPVTRGARPARKVAAARRQDSGESGMISRIATENFKEAARREALTGDRTPRAQRFVHEPKEEEPERRSLPILPGATIIHEEAEAAAAQQQLFVPSPVAAASFRGVQATASIPPDTQGAVGPNHLVVAVNGGVLIQSKTGANLSFRFLEDFFAPVGARRTFDPRVQYDPFGNRWILIAGTEPGSAASGVAVAVSQTSDPTGIWNLYLFDADPADRFWADFPMLGFNKDWIVISANMAPLQNDGSRDHSRVYVLGKANAYAGTSTTLTRRVARPNEDGMGIMPAVTYDATLSTMYLLQTVNGNFNGNGFLRLYTITGAVGSEVFNNEAPPVYISTQSTWNDFTLVANLAPQAGTTQRINTIDSRMQSVVYRNGSLWCAHGVFLPAGAPTRSSVQWWQINPAGAVVQQRGRIDDPGGNLFYAFPSIAVNRNNDVLVGYSRFSATQFAGANYAYRAAADPPGTLRDDTVLKAGEGAYARFDNVGRNRWGDYSSTVVDPSNDVDMWTLQEYAAAGSQWSTWWGRVIGGSAPPPTGPANNNFSAAQLISGNSGVISGSNTGATKEAGEPGHGGNPGGASVWYQWQAPASGNMTVSTAGSNFDTLLAVYTGGAVGALTLVAGNDDVGTGDRTSRVTFPVTAGTTYRIAVDGFNGASGSIQLNWNNVPLAASNNNFAGAQAITGASGSVAGNNGGATKEAGEPGHGGNPGGASVWYRWQAPFSGFVTFTTAGSNFDTLLGAYTGSSVNALTLVAGNDDVDAFDLTSRVTFNITGGTTYRIAVDGWSGATGSIQLNWSAVNVGSTVQFGAATASVNEVARRVQLNVTRSGNTSAPAAVNYATADGTADRRRDYTQSLGTLSFAAGETSKSVTVFVTDDTIAESPETFTVSLTSPSGISLGTTTTATVTINSDDATTGPNPIDSATFNTQYFVRQHYVDFLNREPDAGGLAFWAGGIESCGANQQCREVKKIDTSAAFFLSIEFQETGYLACRVYKAAYGDATSPGVPGTVPVIRLDEFLPDSQRIGQNVQVGVGNWQQQLEANKNAYVLEFVQRPRFLAAFPTTMTPTQFVDKLNQNAGAVLSATERTQLVNELTAANNATGRASALRKVAEDADMRQRELNRAFVLMQYYGYMRRNPDDPQDTNFGGWKFWLDKLNLFNGNYADAEMVKAFITSIEYKNRFGP